MHICVETKEHTQVYNDKTHLFGLFLAWSTEKLKSLFLLKRN